MIFVFWVVVGLMGAAIHLWRDKQPRTDARVLEVLLLYWLVVPIGIGGLVGGIYHLVDGPSTAQTIGFTNGDGGFQTEVGFGDLGVGVAGILCIWFRDRFWLAVIAIASISLIGDGFGHIHQEVANDNHDPDNTGAVLYSDFAVPILAMALYGLLERARGRGRSAASAS